MASVRALTTLGKLIISLNFNVLTRFNHSDLCLFPYPSILIDYRITTTTVRSADSSSLRWITRVQMDLLGFNSTSLFPLRSTAERELSVIGLSYSLKHQPEKSLILQFSNESLLVHHSPVNPSTLANTLSSSLGSIETRLTTCSTTTFTRD